MIIVQCNRRFSLNLLAVDYYGYCIIAFLAAVAIIIVVFAAV